VHRCRRAFASLMIAAGVNAKALRTYMGPASISIALDSYARLMPDRGGARCLLDTYLAAEHRRSALECAGLRVQSMVSRFG
jgi:integrase